MHSLLKMQMESNIVSELKKFDFSNYRLEVKNYPLKFGLSTLTLKDIRDIT